MPGQKDSPSRIEVGAATVEAFRGAGLNLSRPASWMEATRPFPGIFVMRTADVDRDRADMDVTTIDVHVLDIGGG